MIDNNALEPASEDNEATLYLPIKKRELGEFISGLLGQQQSIERYIDIKFDINYAWLVNLHELISQRIHQQAEAHLTNFTTVIYFEDGLKRTLTSVEAFKCYSETKKQIPIGVKIIWDYLIKFPAKKLPEKQQITFSAQISPSKDKQSKHPRNKLEYYILSTIIGETERSSLNYQIDHTERTWGDDIETIISNQVNEVIRGSQFKDTLFNLSRLILVLMVFMFSTIYPIYADVSDTNKIMSEALTNYSALGDTVGSTINGVNKKLDHIASMIEILGRRNENKVGIFLFIFGGPFFAIILLRLTRKDTYSFLVFSKESEKNRKLKLEQERRSTWILIGSFVLSVLAGIIGNYSYAWMIK